MQTNFTPEQLQDPHIRVANEILRKCVHCGFCTATCPTYVLLGDELDSPRGRIYLIKNMLERGEAATPETVKHIDRCLSCLACMTTCPSGVHYMHLIDDARTHVEKTYRRPFVDRALRGLLAFLMPRPGLFKTALILSQLVRPLAPLIERLGDKRLSSLLALAPRETPPPEMVGQPGVYPAEGQRRMRVALLRGCVQSVLDPAINEAAIRLMNRNGIEVVVTEGEVCCGSWTHHMGKEKDALARARRLVDAWDKEDIYRIIITASGCGTTVKDYGHMLRLDPAYAEKAKAVSAKTRDITEFLTEIDLPEVEAPRPLRVAYHSACSMQHGQKITYRAAPTPGKGRLRRRRDSRGPSMLRLRRHLQYPAARDRNQAQGPQAGQYQLGRARYHRHRQYRMHHPVGTGERHSHSPHCGVA